MEGKVLKDIIKSTGIEQSEVAKKLGLTPQGLNSKLKAASIKTDFLQKVGNAINKTVEQMMEMAATQPAKTPLPVVIPDRNAHALGLPVDIHTTKAGLTFIELSEGQYLMYAPHVTERARAGFQGGGYGDPIYLESLPKYAMVVGTVHKGKYFVYDITGDSMDDGTIRSIPDKSKALAREIKLDLWRSRFHYNEFPYFIIVHKTDGIMCKEIIAHDVERGVITCHSLNPNKEMYPDFELPLDDCLMICNIVKKELPANL